MPASKLDRAPSASTIDERVPLSSPLTIGSGMLPAVLASTVLRSSAPVVLVPTVPSDSGPSTEDVSLTGLSTAEEIG